MDSATAGPPSNDLDIGSDRLNLRSLLSFLRRRMLMIATIVAISLVLSVIVTQAMQSLYTAQATVVVQAKADQVTPSSAKTDDPVRPVAEQIETEVQLVKSRDVAGRVVDKLGLLQDAAFMAKAEQSRKPGFVSRLLGAVPPATVGSDQLRDDAIDNLLTELDVRRVGTSYALGISYSDPDPEAAAKVVNAFAEIYTQHEVSSQASANKTAIGLLQTRMEELRRQAQADFDAVQQYRIRNALQTKSGTSLTEQEISAYNQQVAVARSDASRDAARLAAARAQQRVGGDGVGEAAGSPVLAALRSQRATLSAHLTELSDRYFPNYPEVVAAREQLADIDRQIAREVDRSVDLLASNAQASGARLGSLQGSLGSASGKLDNNNRALVTLNDLERRADASQALYDSYLNRFKESVASAGAEQPSARLMSPAPVPKKPSSPILLLNLLLGLLVGVLAGVGAAIGVESTYDGLTTREDVERRLSVRHLGSIPLLESIAQRGVTPIATISGFPGGAFTESMRGALAAVRQTASIHSQVIAVSSALPDEGKTTIAACLASAAALGHERVAIVDCDVVRSSLSRMFVSDRSRPGLRQLFAGAVNADVFAARPDLGGAILFPITQPFDQGARLLEQGQFQRLLAELRGRFDLIILDCPPIVPIAEARELVACADNLVFVAQWRRTSDRTVRAALKMLPPKVFGGLGVLLNRVDTRKRVRFGDGDPEMFSAKAKDYYTSAAPAKIGKFATR
jgi:uncharacterized protein involved in exopolysaccharide biosynthesis/Mrp family chromosome partitioning ATPase